jgi:hypothetical protein
MGSTTGIAAMVALAGALVAFAFLPARAKGNDDEPVEQDLVEHGHVDRDEAEPVLV